MADTFPAAPYLDGYGPFYDSYTFPNVSDFPSTFIEEAGSQANTYIESGGIFDAYHIELHATKRSAPRNGDGSSDYAFTPSSLLAFYEGFASSGTPVYFNESYTIFDSNTYTYLDGESYADYNARITRVVTDIPEPSSVTQLLAGLMLLAAQLWAGCRTSFARYGSSEQVIVTAPSV